MHQAMPRITVYREMIKQAVLLIVSNSLPIILE
jgi:hypothetical protein